MQLNNSPKGVLDVVFCAWINESALTVEQKIELARSAIERYPNAWDVIASKLPHGTSSICSTLNTPKYRRIDEPEELYVHEGLIVIQDSIPAILDKCKS